MVVHPAHQSSILAEVGTVQLEFRYLSRHTGDSKYAEVSDAALPHYHTANSAFTFHAHLVSPCSQAAEGVIHTLKSNQPSNGLFPIYISPQTGRVRTASADAHMMSQPLVM